jgi:proteic killer suppression protein
VAIVSFHEGTTQDIYDGADTKAARKIPRELWPTARRKLDMINAARDVLDLRSPPGNRLEKLRGDLAGRYSIRVNEQYRIVFEFAHSNASDVWLNKHYAK